MLVLTDSQHLFKNKAQYLFICVDIASINFTTNFKAGDKKNVQYFPGF